MQAINQEIVFSGSGQYGSYRVIDLVYYGRPSRMLFGQDGSPQSGMAKDDDPELPFDYNQRFLEIMKSHLPGSCLVIGGGVLMLPKAAYELFPSLTIDVVEIDKLLVRLAYEYFEVPNDPRLNVHVADGIDFVKSTQLTYDMIIIDAFTGYTVPPHLVDAAAAQQYKKILNKSGTVAINLISEYKPGKPSVAHDIITSFARSFEYVEAYQSDPEDEPGREQNMILVASDAKLSLDYLQSVNILR